MQVDGINVTMANVANTGNIPAKKQADSAINVDDSFNKNNDIAWKNFQADQKISVLQQQIASDKKKSRLYSSVMKGLVALSIGAIMGGGIAASMISSPVLMIASLGIGAGSMILGGKTYRIAEGLELRAMQGESKVSVLELEKMGNNLGLDLDKMRNNSSVDK